MADIAPELYDKIVRKYNSGVASDPVIKSLKAKAAKTYEDAQLYARRVGGHAAKALTTTLTGDVLPDGKMYFNIAERTIKPAMKTVYKEVAAYCEETQTVLNEAAQIGMKAIKPALNDDRILGILNRANAEELFDSVKWLLDAPIVNFSQSVVDDSVFENARFQSEAGLKPKIRRYSNGKCCDWCEGLAGEYDYPPSDPEVWFRHDNCTCVTTYYPAEGKSKGVWGSRVGGLTKKTEYNNWLKRK